MLRRFWDLATKLMKTIRWRLVTLRSVQVLFVVFTGVIFSNFFGGESIFLHHWRLITLAALMILALAASQATIFRTFGARLIDLILDIFVSLSVGLIVVMATTIPEAKPGTPINTWPQIEEIIVAAAVVFAATLVGRASTVIEEADAKLQDQVTALGRYTADAKTLQTTVHQATESIEEARFAGLAARVLDVREEALRRERGGKPARPDVGIVDSVEQGVEALRAWLFAGDRIRREFASEDPDDDEWCDAARQAWWRTMRVYEKEEVFDVSRQELATNIRNYAFILLAVISEFLCRVKTENERCGNNLSRRLKLVVANVSGFAPKDFYNYPDGAKGNRFYHEAEFFGTYRRALAQVVSDPHVYPIRTVLASPQESGSGEPDPEQRKTLGWAFDSLEKLVLDCARLHAVPWPITDRTKWKGTKDEDFQLTQNPSKESMAVEFPPDRDPALRMPARIKRYLYAPLFVDFGGFSRIKSTWINKALKSERKHEHAFLKEIDNAMGAPLPKRGKNGIFKSGRTRLERFEENRSEILAAYFDGNSPRSLTKRSTEAMDGLLDAIRFSCGIQDEKWNPEFEKWVQYGLSQWPDGQVEHHKFAQYVEDRGLKKGSDLMEKPEERQVALRCLSSVVKVRAYAERLGSDLEPSQRTDNLLALFEECQRIDALVRLLGVRSGKVKGGMIASTGVELGWAEDWLHRTLACDEGMQWQKKSCGRPVALWRLLMSDLCGCKDDDLPDDKVGESSLAQRLLRHLRIAVVARDGDDGGNTVDCGPGDTKPSPESDDPKPRSISEHEMLEDNILAEFLMVGVVSESKLTESDSPDRSGLIDKVRWLALVGAEMSEPLHTCRVEVHFAHGKCTEASCRLPICKHKQWLSRVWEDRLATDAFLKEVAIEYAKTIG